MDLKKLKDYNQNLPILGDRLLTDLEMFQKLCYDEILISVIEQIFFLNEQSKKSLISDLNKIIEEPQRFEKEESNFFLLIDISNRYLMIKELIVKESLIKFGLFGTLLYLGLTCFDSLGQKNEFITFQEWLNWKKNEGINELQRKIDSKEKINLKNNLNDLYENKYKPEFGAKNSFFQFLNSIKERNSFKMLFLSINLIYPVQKQKENYLDFEEKLKEGWLYSFRNNFTHNTKNTRFPLNSEPYILGYNIGNQTFHINVKPKELLENVLICVKDGIELRLNQIGISLQ